MALIKYQRLYPGSTPGDIKVPYKNSLLVVWDGVPKGIFPWIPHITG